MNCPIYASHLTPHLIPLLSASICIVRTLVQQRCSLQWFIVRRHTDNIQSVGTIAQFSLGLHRHSLPWSYSRLADGEGVIFHARLPCKYFSSFNNAVTVTSAAVGSLSHTCPGHFPSFLLNRVNLCRLPSRPNCTAILFGTNNDRSYYHIGQGRAET